MIIFVEKKSKKVTEGKNKNWFDYILDHLNSDTAFDILFNIFDGTPHAEGPLLTQAVSELKKKLPSVPTNEIKSYVKIWVENHKNML
jgi:hypothetical protein